MTAVDSGQVMAQGHWGGSPDVACESVWLFAKTEDARQEQANTRALARFRVAVAGMIGEMGFEAAVDALAAFAERPRGYDADGDGLDWPAGDLPAF